MKLKHQYDCASPINTKLCKRRFICITGEKVCGALVER